MLRDSNYTRLRLPAYACLLALTCATSMAQENAPVSDSRVPAGRDQLFDLSLSAGMAFTDNIGRQPADEDSGTIGLAGIQLAYAQKSLRLESDIDVNATYESYSDDAFDDDVIGGADAMLRFGIVPDRLTWLVLENFGQVSADPFAADTPENREDINYFTTGPNLLLNLGNDFSLDLAARYSNVQYESQPADGDQLGGSASFARQLSTISAIALIFDHTKFEFDDETFNPGYSRQQVFVNYKAEGRRTELSADLGYTSLDMEDGSSPDGALARFSISRRMSGAASLSASVGTQFSDSGEMFRQGQSQGSVVTDVSSVVGASDPFRSDFASLAFGYDRNRTEMGIDVSLEKERYENSTVLDRDLMTWSAHVLRHISPTLEVSLFARGTGQDFQTVDYDSDDLDVGGFVRWVVGRTLSLRLQYNHFDRDSSNAAIDFSENRASLRIYWSPVGARGASR